MLNRMLSARLLVPMCLLALLGVAGPARPGADDRPDDFVRLHDVDPTILQPVRYYSDFNFVGARIDGYEAPVIWLTRPAAEALAKVQAELRPRGLTLKVFDAYRPQQAVDHFVRWSHQGLDQKMKPFFYPDIAKRRLFAEGYIASRSGHSRGSTVDLTIAPIGADAPPPDRLPPVPCDHPDPAQRPNEGLDMGTAYDCFSERSHTMNEAVTDEQREHRLLLKTLMERHGFRNYSKEWWHFTLRNEPYPDRYFDFPVTE
jgi:D-alanyl-D-alanine dipeptidase